MPDSSISAAGRRTGSHLELVRSRSGSGARRRASEELQNQLVGLGGLVALAAGTAVEAGLAVKKACSSG